MLGTRTVFLKPVGVCNPVIHVLNVIEGFKRFGPGCKPQPALLNALLFNY